MDAWHEFYTLAGTASATLIGLLFVAASVGSSVWERPAALRVFLSATVVHFSSILVISLCIMAPLRSVAVYGLVFAVGGLFGLVYCFLVIRDTVRDGLSKSIDLEDRTWYAALPVAGYVLMMGAGIAVAMGFEPGAMVLAISIGLLLVAGIRNAWDITVWIVTRRQS
jgi:hypothetical protein